MGKCSVFFRKSILIQILFLLSCKSEDSSKSYRTIISKKIPPISVSAITAAPPVANLIPPAPPAAKPIPPVLPVAVANPTPPVPPAANPTPPVPSAVNLIPPVTPPGDSVTNIATLGSKDLAALTTVPVEPPSVTDTVASSLSEPESSSPFSIFSITAGSSVSSNGVTLALQKDGNLVVQKGSKIVWSSQTQGRNCSDCTAKFQTDGNLVLYDKEGQYFWNTLTQDLQTSTTTTLRLSSFSPYMKILKNNLTVWVSSPIDTTAVPITSGDSKIIITPVFGEPFSSASFCKVTVSWCPNFSSISGMFIDNTSDATSNKDACLKRASDIYAWCGGSLSEAKFVVTSASYISNGTVVETKSYPTDANFGTFYPFSLPAGSSISFNGMSLSMQTNGNLVLSKDTNTVWSSQTEGRSCSGCVAKYQEDGHLVLYDQTGASYWNNGTYGKSNVVLQISTKLPYMEILKPDGSAALWASSAIDSFPQPLMDLSKLTVPADQPVTLTTSTTSITTSKSGLRISGASKFLCLS